MNCPKCNSTQVRKFQVIYQEGTSIGIGGAQGQSPSTTIMAAQCSPPDQPSGSCLLLTIITPFLIYLFYWIFVTYTPKNIIRLIYSPQIIPNYLITALILIFILITSAYIVDKVYFILFGYRKNKEYKEKMTQWKNSWKCLKCGESFYYK